MNEKRIVEGSKALANGHTVSHVQTSHVGWFAKVESTSTEYACSCGRVLHTASRFLKSELARHDAWKTPEQRAADSKALLELMDELLGQETA